MAAAIAKREARRRRILENSESRLRKITGRDDWNELSNDNGKKMDEEINANTHFELDDTTSDSLTTNDVPYAHKIFANHASNHGFTNHKLISDKHETYNKTPEYFRADTDLNATANCKSELQEPLLFQKIIKNRLNYIFLAAAVNVLLICNMGYLFGQVVTLPYFVMVIGRICLYNNLQETQSGSLLIAALILCNIKPELTLRLKTLITLCTVLIHDLALYIFSFTLMYSLISYYLGSYQDNLISPNPLKHVEL